MAKKNNEEKTNSNIFNCRVSSKAKSKELRKRIKSLTDNSSFEEVIEDGIDVHEGRDLEATILKKKSMKIIKREEALSDFISLNAEIEAHNKRLRTISKRQKEILDVSDNVLYLKIYDKEENLVYEFTYKPDPED